jgi:hypothetical protein
MESETHHAQLVAVSGLGSDFNRSECSGDFVGWNRFDVDATDYFFGALRAV